LRWAAIGPIVTGYNRLRCKKTSTRNCCTFERVWVVLLFVVACCRNNLLPIHGNSFLLR
jgi:hypothetical protein